MVINDVDELSKVDMSLAPPPSSLKEASVRIDIAP